jgi:hypothetical protein
VQEGDTLGGEIGPQHGELSGRRIAAVDARTNFRRSSYVVGSAPRRASRSCSARGTLMSQTRQASRRLSSF